MIGGEAVSQPESRICCVLSRVLVTPAMAFQGSLHSSLSG